MTIAVIMTTTMHPTPPSALLPADDIPKLMHSQCGLISSTGDTFSKILPFLYKNHVVNDSLYYLEDIYVLVPTNQHVNKEVR